MMRKDIVEEDTVGQEKGGKFIIFAALLQMHNSRLVQ